MKKYFTTIIISLLIGFLLSNHMLKEYQSIDIKPVFNQTEKLYLLQQGVYSNLDSMKKHTTNLSSYVYNEIDNLFHVYIGMSLEVDNIKKIKNYYDKKNIKTIIKDITISDTKFIEQLKNFDLVIKNTEEEETIKEIIKETLEKYKEE